MKKKQNPKHKRKKFRISSKVREQYGSLPVSSSDDTPTLILSQAAHMDWDWLNWNPQLETGKDQVYSSYFQSSNAQYKQPSETIFRMVYELMQSTDIADYGDYYYSSCEMAFLKDFAENYATEFQALVESGRLVIVGGGVTSPDNLLPSSESFIRNFLIGKQWVESQDLVWTNCVWLPDDFGHDSQLPVVLEAMGTTAVGFSRIPGSCLAPVKYDVEGYESTSGFQLLDETNGGVTFFWQANDGSEIIAHWLQYQYRQGNTIDNYNSNTTDDFSTLEKNQDCNGPDSGGDYSDHITHYISTNQSVAPTPAIYVHVSNDFAVPKGIEQPIDEVSPDTITVDAENSLQYYAQQWNDTKSDDDPTVVASTFVDYISRVIDYENDNQGTLKTRSFHGSDSTNTFQPTPYWMGFYAAHPALKYLNFSGTRLLLAAEIFQQIAAALGVADSSNDDAISTAWNDLVPSTHHDYITGTGLNDVYNTKANGEWGEQLQLSLQAYREGLQAQTTALESILDNLTINTSGTVVAFNPLGLARTDIVEITTDQGADNIPSNLSNVQYNSDGSRLLFATAPSMGYAALYPYGNIPDDGVSATDNGDSGIVLENQYIQATISSSDGSISSLIDKSTNSEVFSSAANVLQFYEDGGDCYKFGYETETKAFSENTATQSDTSYTITEEGPVRAVVTVETTFSVNDDPYEIEYSLVAGEPFLRIALTGSSPEGTSVMVNFPLQSSIETLNHGTPCHWDYKTVEDYPPVSSVSDFNSIFQATQDFVTALDDTDAALGGILHSGGPTDFDGNGQGDEYADDVPGSVVAWAASDSSLLGCVLRSVNDPVGSSNNDPDTHRIDYAFIVPSAISDPSEGTMLQTARRYNTPMTAYASDTNSGSISGGFSLAATSAASGNPMLLAAKAGTFDSDALILRVYNPTNSTNTVSVDITDYYNAVGGVLVIALITALEDTSNETVVTSLKGTFQYIQDTALETISIKSNQS